MGQYRDLEKRAKWVKEYAIKNKDIIREYKQKYRDANKEKCKDAARKSLQKRLEIEPDYEIKRARKWRGLPEPTRPTPLLCEICNRTEAKLKKSTGQPFALSLDHCHETGKFRGWLCDRCNRNLGWYKDDPSVFYRAAKYLEGTLELG